MLRGDSLREMVRSAERAYAHAENNDERRRSRALLNALTQCVDHGNPEYLRAFQALKRFPVDIEEFISSEEFLRGTTMEIWPTLVDDIKAMNPDTICGEHPNYEALLGGATGTGKTTLSQCTNLYQIYLFSCFDMPQRLYGLAGNTPIIFTMMSVNVSITRTAIYKPLREVFVQMPFIRRWVPWNTYIESTLILPEQNVQVIPAQANVTSIVGQAIAGGIIDEVNFMAVIDSSKQVAGRRGDGGKYDQAEETYTNVSRRREGRFQTRGLSMGTLCVLSSTRYKDDFIDRRMEQVRKNNERGVYIFRKKQYEVQPRYVLNPHLETFRLLVGNDRYPTKVLEPHEEAGRDYPENAQVENVPINYRPAFLSDPENALRDVIGIATDTISAFITRRNKIVDAVLLGSNQYGLQNWVTKPVYDLAANEFPEWNPEAMPKTKAEKEIQRFAHVDLSQTKDRCGIAISSIAGTKKIIGENGEIEEAPLFKVEAIFALKPSALHPVEMGEIRRFLMQLVDFYKISLVEVTFDGFQSKDSQQILMRSGIVSREISMDTKMEPYEYLRRALYEDRIAMVEHELCRTELSRLELHVIKEKIDHPPKGCFTGDTRIALLDGTQPTFEELAKRYGPDETFPVYSMGPDGVCVGQGRNPRVTRENAELVEVTLDNYQVIRCTPDHLFMTLDGEWVQAQNLTPDVSIMPLYRTRAYKGGWSDYERVWCPRRNRRLLTHQMAAGLPEGAPAGFHVHHKDENKANNVPGNLELIAQADHARKHTTKRHQTDTFYVSRLREGHKQYRENGGNEKSRLNMLRLYDEGILKRGRAPCCIEGCEKPSQAKGMCDVHYQQHRRVRLKAERSAKQTNHRILSVRRLDERADVWDITVDVHHNFALSSGVFVHNSKDCSDAMCGSIYGAATSRFSRGIAAFRDKDGKVVQAPILSERPQRIERS